MSTIEQLNRGTLTSGSQLPFYDPANRASRRASVAELAEVLQSELSTPPNGLVTRYAAPSATGFSVTITPPTAGASVFLLVSPGGAYATGTIVLPVGVEAQEILVHCRQAVSTLTVTPASGNTISGAPAAITAGGFFRLRFDSIEALWARIG